MLVLSIAFLLTLFLILTIVIIFFESRRIDKIFAKQTINEREIENLKYQLESVRNSYEELNERFLTEIEYKNTYKNILKAEGKIK